MIAQLRRRFMEEAHGISRRQGRGWIFILPGALKDIAAFYQLTF